MKAALAAKTVVIRGRTDADAADPTEERIASSRALHARAYLVSRGVPAAKIRSWYWGGWGLRRGQQQRGWPGAQPACRD